MYEFRKHHFTSWQDHKKSSDCRLPSYSFVLFSWKLFEIKTKNYEAIRVDLFFTSKIHWICRAKNCSLWPMSRYHAHNFAGKLWPFFCKKKQLKNLPFWQWLHCTMEKKNHSQYSTLLLLVLVLLLCSSNTESASYGDRNQGGAIFYCANTEKVVL